MTKEMEFNEEMATAYDKGVRRTLPTFDPIFKLVHAYLRANTATKANVLIVGAGGGNELITFGPSNPEWSFTAVDPAAAMLDIAKMKVHQLTMTERVKFVEGTVDKVDIDSLYNAATCMLVLHFIPTIEEKLQLLKGIRKRLESGAPFVLTSMYGDRNDPAFEELFALWKIYWLATTKLTATEMDEMEISVRDLSFIPEEQMVYLLREAGFKNIAKFFTTNMFGGWICKAK